MVYISLFLIYFFMKHLSLVACCWVLFSLVLVWCSHTPSTIHDLGASIEREWQLLVLQNIWLEEFPDVCALLTPEQAIWIKSIDAIDNTIQNVSWDLTCLPNLTEIDLSFNEVTQVGYLWVPLKKLFVQGNELSSLSDISQMYTGLQSLVINQNNLTNLDGVERFANLRNLELHNNQLTNLEGLQNLTRLEKIKLEWNQLDTLDILDDIPNLGFVTARRNQIPEEELIPREQKTRTYVPSAWM